MPEADVTAAAGDPLLGTTLGERYTIIGRVGAGGMGTVYRAEQAPMNREIALKVLRRDLGRDPETVARFHREGRTLSQLKHPNTVTIFDFGQTDDGLLYLAMELLEGEMLSSRLKRDGALDVSRAIMIAEGVLRSLGEAHSRGIVHRDLKPDNIFIAKVHGPPDEDEIVKVVDFGIAKIRDGERGLEPLQTQEGTVFGTPRYMSPEQAQGKPLDGRSDLYAVGVLLFHMLTGRAPFTDDDAVVVMAHHIKTIPPPVREAAPGRPIPASLEALVARALEKEPAQRPQTAEGFLAELEVTRPAARALAAAALVASTTPAEVSVAPGTRRSRLVWLGAGGLAVLAVAAGFAAASPRAVASRPATSPRPATVVMPPATRGPDPALAAAGPLPAQETVVAPLNADAPAAELDGAPVVESATRTPARRRSAASRASHRRRRAGQPYPRWSD